MDYQSILENYFQPLPEATPTPGPVIAARPARRLRDAIEPLAMHSVWCRRTNERLATFGLSFFGGYVWGRAAALGEPPASLVVASFGVFEPGLLSAVYEEARGRVGRVELLKGRAEATIESLREVLGGVDLAQVLVALRRGLEAADGTGRPLFSGLQSLDWPAEPVGQLWRACELLREHRGDSHIAACITAGLGPVAMNVLTELWVGMPLGSYTATRGWSPEVIAATVERLRSDGLVADGALTAAGRQLREEIEERTDAMQQSIVDAIGEDFEAVVAQLDAWSAACIEAKAFPPSALKRAAG